MTYFSMRADARSSFVITSCWRRASDFSRYSLKVPAVKYPRSSFLTLCGNLTIEWPSMSRGRLLRSVAAVGGGWRTDRRDLSPGGIVAFEHLDDRLAINHPAPIRVAYSPRP